MRDKVQHRQLRQQKNHKNLKQSLHFFFVIDHTFGLNIERLVHFI